MTARPLTGCERHFAADEIIVSKTDEQGRIIYANEVFLRVSGYAEAEVLGQPHNIIRHPDMPRVVFKLLWDTIQAGRECFAYVLNRAKGGDHYWVLAHITPSFASDGGLLSYHSSRRSPRAEAVRSVSTLYRDLAAVEGGHADRAAGLAAAEQVLADRLAALGQPYDEFIFAL